MDLVPGFTVAGIGLALVVVPLVDIALATVFFGVVGTTFTQARLQDALAAGSWVPLIGYLVCAAATLLLPTRAQVQAHAREG